jgi:hypothetical protein
VSSAGEVRVPRKYKAYFEFIQANPDIFPGFFHVDLRTNVLPKLALLREFGFYPRPRRGSAIENAAARR